MNPTKMSQLPKPGDLIRFKPISLPYESQCDDCGDKIEIRGERWFALWAKWMTAADAYKDKGQYEIKATTRCGPCMEKADASMVVQTALEGLWVTKKKEEPYRGNSFPGPLLKEGKDEATTCATPRRTQGTSKRVYLSGAPAPRD